MRKGYQLFAYREQLSVVIRSHSADSSIGTVMDLIQE
jgi:hypothetical protein